MNTKRIFIPVIFLVTLLFAGSTYAREIIDGMGRKVVIDDKISRVICSGPGCLRLLTYLQAQDLVIAVDDMEVTRGDFDARPYALANPKFKKLPIFGVFRGQDNPELILGLDPQPQVIFKTYSNMGMSADDLHKKTGIPVIALNYGNLGKQKDDFYATLRLMGNVLNKKERAEALVSYFEQTITDLQKRTNKVSEKKQPSVYVGGIASKGPHPFNSTEPGYPPFTFVNANNVAQIKSSNELSQMLVSKEQIVVWDPDYIFIDLANLQLGDKSDALYELANDPAYSSLKAVKNKKVYGVLPYNWYSQNFESILADAYYIGKVLYPDTFKDIEPEKKADEIYKFLVGEQVFDAMNKSFRGLVFKTLSVK